MRPDEEQDTRRLPTNAVDTITCKILIGSIVDQVAHSTESLSAITKSHL